MSYKRKSSFAYSTRAAKAVRLGMNIGKRLYRVYRGKQNRARSITNASSSGPLTVQHDVRTSRKTKKLSKAKKRQIKFDEKVVKSIGRHKGLISLSESNVLDLISVSGSPINYGAQKQMPMELQKSDYRLGCYRTNVGKQGLYNYIIEIHDSGREAIASGISASSAISKNTNQEDFVLTSSKANLALKNVWNDTIYVDVYECVSRTNITRTDYKTAQACWDYMLTQSAQFNAATGTPAFTTVRARAEDSGQTPYMCPEFGTYWKIVKKTRIQLGSGSYTNYTYSGYRGKVHFSSDLQEEIQPGKCKDIIIVANPTYNAALNADIGLNVLEVQVTKTYTMDWADAPGKNIGYAGTYSIS